MKTIEKIEKEKISNLKFSRKEVLRDEMARRKRAFDLMRAQALGNLSRSKVTITFEDASEKIYQVSTTVWATGNEFVALKCNTYIPVNSILEVD